MSIAALDYLLTFAKRSGSRKARTPSNGPGLLITLDAAAIIAGMDLKTFQRNFF
jgi:hypothetical protein